MELIKTDYKIRCELGTCKNLATVTVKLSRAGVKSRIHVCEKCLKELGELIDNANESNTLSEPTIRSAKKKSAKAAEANDEKKS